MIEELKALKLERGGVYVLELQHGMGQEKMTELSEKMSKAIREADLDIKFVILGPNLKIARERREAEPFPARIREELRGVTEAA